MLKKIGSFFINSFAVIVLGLLSILLVVRMFFMPSSMSKLAEAMFDEELFLAEELDKYIDKDILIDEMGKFLSDYFRYAGGAPDAELPSAKGLVDIMREMVEKYEDEIGEEIAIEQDFEELYEELEAGLEYIVNEPVDDDIKMVFSIVYSQPLLIGLIAAFVVCILLNYLMRKDCFIVMKHTGIVTGVNAVIFIACGVLVNSYASSAEDVSDTAMIKCFVDNFYTIGLVSLVISVVFITLSIVLKKRNNDFNTNNTMNNNYLGN